MFEVLHYGIGSLVISIYFRFKILQGVSVVIVINNVFFFFYIFIENV